MNKIKDMNKEIRPRERLIEVGPTSLSDAELLAILLRTGNKEENALLLSERIINEAGGISNISSINTLSKIKGVGIAKATTIMAALELGKRSLKHNYVGRVNNTKEVYDLFKYDLNNLKQEHFIALYLDPKNNIITSKVIFIGTIDRATVHPREIFKEAIKNSATKIIIIHNHPTGDSTPSKADIETTASLKEIGNFMSIPIIDHVIIGYHNYYSFIDQERVDVNEEI